MSFKSKITTQQALILEWIGIILPISIACISLGINFWQANKGLIMYDEAWYLYLLKDLPHGLSSQFHLLLKNVFNGDIFLLRCGVILSNIIGSVIFSFGLYSLFKVQLKLRCVDYFLLWAFTVASVFSVVIMCFSYLSLNTFVTQVGLGLIFWGLSLKNSLKSTPLIFLGGSSLGFLTFIMFTNTPIFLLVVIGIYYLSEDSTKFKNCLYFSLGILFSIALYFLFFESYELFVSSLKTAIVKTAHNQYASNHGLKAMIWWSFKAIQYVIEDVFPALMFSFGLYYVLDRYRNRIISILLSFFLLLMLGIYCYYSILNNKHGIASVTPFYTLYIFYILLLFLEEKQSLKENIGYLFMGVIILPFILSLGTDVDFKVRASVYMPLILPFIFLSTRILREKKIYYFILLGFFTLYFAVNIFKLTRSNWGDTVYLKQTFAVKTLGISQNIYLDKDKFDILSDLQTKTHKYDSVIMSDQIFWGYSYLLDLKPISYDFRFNEEEILSILTHQSIGNRLVLLASADKPLDSLFFNKIKNIIKIDSITSQKFALGTVYVCYKSGH